MEAFTRELLALRRRYGVFRRTAFLHVQDMHDARALWLTRDAKEMTVADWEDPAGRLLVVALQTGIADAAPRHGWVLLVINGGEDADRVRLPEGLAEDWRLVFSTAEQGGELGGGVLDVPARSIQLFEACAT
jgi:pullulanase/glycogen debranching enzyme